jgi:hypothetical protein
MDCQWEEFKVEVKRSKDNFKDEMVKTMRGISEQMSCLVKNQNQNVVPMHHEFGAHMLGLWCTHCKQPNHTAQFCPILLQQQPYQSMSVNTQPYRPPHQVGQAASNPTPGHQFQPHNCGICGNKHPLGKCWIEN